MSVKQRPPDKMPQPEQWLSEHEPWSTLAIVFVPFLLAGLLGWWFG